MLEPTAVTGTTTPRTGADTVTSLMQQIEAIGRDGTRGGYSRPVYSGAELELREWFIDQATRRGLDVETDPLGIIWAWWDGRVDGQASGAVVPRENAVLTGSHLDSVPGGGAFDGPLGVASSLIAVDLMQARGVTPARPIAVAVFPEEEGSRFGVACLGSRLLAGAIDPDKALALKDPDGRTFAEVARANGLNPEHIRPDAERVGRVGEFVELHVEQGRGLIDHNQPVAIGSSILGHGRWRFRLEGQGNHAGTTLMQDRKDPMVAAAGVIAAVRRVALRHPGARATVGRLVPIPGGTNVIASVVDLWLDVRHPEDAVTAAVVEQIYQEALAAAAEEGCTAVMTEESLSRTTHFDPALRDQLGGWLPDAPILDTGAGHDAGVLAGSVPTAMLFVRNPSGISHSPEEYVDDADAEAGAAVLADVLARMVSPADD